MMAAVVSSLGLFHDRLDIRDYEHRMVTARRLIAKMPTIAAACYKAQHRRSHIYPRDDLSYTGNLLYMMFSLPGKRYEVDPSPSGRWMSCSLCTPTMSRTLPPRPYDWPAPREPIPMPPLPQASPVCRVQRMAAPTKPYYACWTKSATSKRR